MRPMAHIDERACAAHGDCLDVAPQAFALSDDDVAVVIGTAPADVLVARRGGLPLRRDLGDRRGHRRAALSLSQASRMSVSALARPVGST